jgi:membrane-associated phospholipid phosphatase
MRDLMPALAERCHRPIGRDGGRTWHGAGVALAWFVLVAVVGSWPGVVTLNASALRWLQATFPFGSFDAISLLLVFGASQVSLGLLAACGLWLFLRGERLVALSLGFVFVGVALEVLLKATLGHPMVWEEFSHGAGLYPFPEFKTTVVALASPFPSGHVLRAAYLAMTLVALLVRRLRGSAEVALRAIAALFVAGVVFGVLYLGWHWPTDALGSLALAYALTAPTRCVLGETRRESETKPDRIIAQLAENG